MQKLTISNVQTLRQEQILAPMQLQSLEFLMAPVLELQGKLISEIEQNPVLDTPDKVVEPSIADLEGSSIQKGTENSESSEDSEYSNLISLGEELAQHGYKGVERQSKSVNDEKYEHFLNSIIDTPSLEEELEEQLVYADIDEDLRERCKLIVGSIDEKGYFVGNIRDLSVLCGADEEEMENALRFIQTFDPVGVGCRDLRECLLLQLRRKNLENSNAYKIVDEYLQELGSNKIKFIADRLSISIEDIREAMKVIQKLTPYPHMVESTSKAEIIVPEIVISKVDDEYQVVLKNEYLPELRISDKYLKMLQDDTINAETKKYIGEKIARAHAVMKSIEQRQETIKSIVKVIVDAQYDFFEQGVEGLKPLTMQEVADKVGVHETTVSRTVANKYAETPQGVYELRYFFMSGFQSESGDVISNKSIMEKVRQIIDNENKSKPLSDDAISKILKEDGLTVARRTVTKYREELGIFSSRQRKEVL